MARYIDADKIPFNEKIPFNRANEGETTIKYAYKSDIDAVPTADVRPERYGEWVHLGGDEWGCSCCGFVISTESSREHPISETQCNNYCRKCGAKMDGKDGDSNE